MRGAKLVRLSTNEACRSILCLYVFIKGPPPGMGFFLRLEKTAVNSAKVTSFGGCQGNHRTRSGRWVVWSRASFLAPGRIDGYGAAGRLGVGAKAGPLGGSSAVRAGPGWSGGGEIPGKQGRSMRVPENVQTAFHSILWVDGWVDICLFFSLFPSWCFVFFLQFSPCFYMFLNKSIFEFVTM